MIVAATSLMDVAILRKYFQVRRSALAISLVATAGVIPLGVLEGIIVAVALAILLFFRRNWWPHGAPRHDRRHRGLAQHPGPPRRP